MLVTQVEQVVIEPEQSAQGDVQAVQTLGAVSHKPEEHNVQLVEEVQVEQLDIQPGQVLQVLPLG